MRKTLVSLILAFFATSLFAAEPDLILTSTGGGEFNGVRNTKKSYHITSKDTNTPATQNVTLYSVTVNTSNAGTSWTLTLQDKNSTPLFVVDALTLATSQNPLVITFSPGIVCKGGLDIITGGTTAGVADVYIAYR